MPRRKPGWEVGDLHAVDRDTLVSKVDALL
jgi:hypothetical protein